MLFSKEKDSIYTYGVFESDSVEIATFLLVADEDLQGNGCLHFNRHLVVVDQAEAGQLQSCLQVLVTLKLDLTEVMQDPTGLWGNTRTNGLYFCRILLNLEFPSRTIKMWRVEKPLQWRRQNFQKTLVFYQIIVINILDTHALPFSPREPWARMIWQRDTYSGSHIAQLTAEQSKDVVLQHELHLVFIDLFLFPGESRKLNSG